MKRPQLDAHWRKSSYSQPSDSYCVEARVPVPGAVSIRDSKNPHGPQLVVDFEAWTAFVALVVTEQS